MERMGTELSGRLPKGPERKVAESGYTVLSRGGPQWL